MLRKTIIAGILSFGVSLTGAQAALLGSLNRDVNFEGGNPTPVSAINFQLIFSENRFGGTPLIDVLLADGVYSVDSGANFDAAVALLTNGDNDFVIAQTALDIGGGGGRLLSEDDFFPGGGGPDFQGFVISRIVATISNARVFVGTSFSASYNFKIEVYGDPTEVPLPAAAPLFLAGLAGASFLRLRKKQGA